MTGGSLGQRAASYGSLPPLQNSVILPLYTTPVVVRKPPKMLLSNSREKEKLIPRICKFVGRRRVGMLLLLVVSVVVLMSLLSAVTKDEDLPEGPGSHQTAILHLMNTTDNETMPSEHTELPTSAGETENVSDNGSSLSNTVPIMNEQIFDPKPLLDVGNILPLDPRPLLDVGNILPRQHPCEQFSLPSPPPPSDRKRIGPRPCPVCYVPVEEAIARMPHIPSPSPVLRNLTYVQDENPVRIEPFGGSEFGGYPSLKQRNNSFDVQESMNVHCGFVRGRKPGIESGFDIDDSDLLEMEQCRGVVVASAIFGNYDIIQQPKSISEDAKQNVCFYMFVDEETEAYMKNSSSLDDRKKVGLWRIIVVRNLPYVDARRNGKVPKLLLHRIFPNARFSIWIDGKLELVVDPYQILERFLWQKNATFAISRHYRRFDVFVEAEANKVAAKYDNASIDFQIDFYRSEGLTPYSEAKLPITSDVPEGCVIIREHIPITNLFTCLWFNEVDRFTSRDQLSFSTVRDKIMSKVDWSVSMFMDCERRNFVVQAYHRDVLEHMAPPPPTAIVIHPPPMLPKELPRKSLPLPSRKRGRDRRSSSRRHRPRLPAANRDSSSTLNM
ncbi:strawberry notch protein [Thalictrum thalictroides]|uniref:Strawberry notch protein n=1 Tax=Thalictrum thalictroides TaxID=46969 RepID=A0A7J6V2B4_THATH|nr:strawberry notch protein [Thalictrum thalictroides]